MPSLSRLDQMMMFVAAGCAATRPIAPTPAEVQAKLRKGVKGLRGGDTVIVTTRDGMSMRLKLAAVEPDRLVGTITGFYRRPVSQNADTILAIPNEAGRTVAIPVDQIVSLEQNTGRTVILMLLLGLVVVFLILASQVDIDGPLGPPIFTEGA